jgi:hypothetical protein
VSPGCVLTPGRHPPFWAGKSQLKAPISDWKTVPTNALQITHIENHQGRGQPAVAVGTIWHLPAIMVQQEKQPQKYPMPLCQPARKWEE